MVHTQAHVSISDTMRSELLSSKGGLLIFLNDCDCKMAAQAITHIAKSLKSQYTSQNLSKSMLAPTLLKRKHGHTTKYKNNSRNSSIYEHCSPQQN